jgi:ABC-type phosphate/phosphonate transport system substrate-binding protein
MWCKTLGVITVSTTRRVRVAAIALLGLVASATAGQEPASRSSLIVCYPNAPGSTEQARPVMERLGAHLSWRTGFELQPVYTNDAAEAQRWIEERRPRFAIVSLPLFLRWRGALALTPIAQSERQNATTERYHLVVRTAAPWRTLEELAAAATPPVIWSSHLDDARFVTRVVFGGALEVGEGGRARGVVTDQPLRALRRMKAGEAFDGTTVDAVLLEDTTWAELQKLQAFREGLRTLHSSPALPTPIVVALGEVDAADAARLRDALVHMHEEPEGRELLTTLQVTGFQPPSTEALAAAIAAYGEQP